MLDEVHLLADGSLSDDVVARLEDLEAQLGQHGGDKVRISVGEQRHGGHQFTTVKVDDLLREAERKCFRFKATHVSVYTSNHYKSRAVSGGLVLC